MPIFQLTAVRHQFSLIVTLVIVSFLLFISIFVISFILPIFGLSASLSFLRILVGLFGFLYGFLSGYCRAILLMCGLMAIFMCFRCLIILLLILGLPLCAVCLAIFLVLVIPSSQSVMPTAKITIVFNTFLRNPSMSSPFYYSQHQNISEPTTQIFTLCSYHQ